MRMDLLVANGRQLPMILIAVSYGPQMHRKLVVVPEIRNIPWECAMNMIPLCHVKQWRVVIGSSESMRIVHGLAVQRLGVPCNPGVVHCQIHKILVAVGLRDALTFGLNMIV